MTDDERANNDKLEFYCNEKFKVHIVLKKKKFNGKNAWVRGYLTRLTDRMWSINDPELGDVELAISQIVSEGVYKFREVSK